MFAGRQVTASVGDHKNSGLWRYRLDSSHDVFPDSLQVMTGTVLARPTSQGSAAPAAWRMRTRCARIRRVIFAHSLPPAAPLGAGTERLL